MGKNKKAMEAERDKRLGRAGAVAAVLFIWLFSLSRLAPTSLAFLWSSSASNEFGSSFFFVWFFFFLLSGNGWWWDPIFLAIVIIIIRRDVDVENGTDRSRRSWEFIQTGSIFLVGFLISKSRVITSAKRTGGEIPFSCTFGRAYRQLFFYKKSHLFSKLFFHSRQSCGDSSPPAFPYSFITFLCPVIDLYFFFSFLLLLLLFTKYVPVCRMAMLLRYNHVVKADSPHIPRPDSLFFFLKGLYYSPYKR